MPCSTPKTTRSGSSERRTNQTLALALTLTATLTPALTRARTRTLTLTLSLTRFVREEEEGVSQAEDEERARLLAGQ